MATFDEFDFTPLYRFYYAASDLITDVQYTVDFEDTDYFKETGRYEESDRTFLFQWNKTISSSTAYRSGQIIRVDRKGYFSLGAVPIAWNYCEVMLHEGGVREIKVKQLEETEKTYHDYPDAYTWKSTQ